MSHGSWVRRNPSKYPDILDINGQSFSTYSRKFENNKALFETLSPRLRSLDWLASHRPDVFATSLYMLSQRRRSETRANPALLPQRGWSLMSLMPVTDSLRTRLGGSWDPMYHASNWPGHLQEAIDEVVEVIWLLRAGLTIPAAIWCRALFERWTSNVASTHAPTAPVPPMSEAYISTVWQEYSSLGVPSSVGSWWGTLSELAHGRDTAGRLGRRMTGRLSAVPAENIEIHEGICEILELVLLQVRGALRIIVEDAEGGEYAKALSAELPELKYRGEPPDLIEAFLELDYFIAHGPKADDWVAIAASYREEIMKPQYRLTTQTDSRLTIGAFIERRGRAITRARAAFDAERSVVGDEFDPGSLAAKLFRHGCHTELARLLAARSDGAEHVALITAADALEGASYLWLNDSDYSMACIRTVLEQTARLRAHRIRRARAISLEARTNTSATRWLEASKWTRLRVLLRAVNEFAHLGPDTRRDGARRILLHVQPQSPDPLRSRGHALDTVVLLFAFELYERLRVSSQSAAELYSKTVILMSPEDHNIRLEQYLTNAEQYTNESFGPRDRDVH
jgi:hypothetical protein